MSEPQRFTVSHTFNINVNITAKRLFRSSMAITAGILVGRKAVQGASVILSPMTDEVFRRFEPGQKLLRQERNGKGVDLTEPRPASQNDLETQ